MGSIMLRRGACCIILLLVFSENLLHAGGDDFFYLSPGITFGMSPVTSNQSVVAGAEVSFGYFFLSKDFPSFGGIIFDGLYDNGRKEGRFMFGAEIGFYLLGLDGGLVMARRNNKLITGYALRPFFCLPLPYPEINIIYYFRYIDLQIEEAFSETGILVKFPIDLSR